MKERLEKDRSTNYCKNKKKQQQVENIQKHTDGTKNESTWVFPKIGVHPNHPFWGYPYFWKHPHVLVVDEVFFWLSRLWSHQDVKQDVLVGGFKYVKNSHSYSGKKWSNLTNIWKISNLTCAYFSNWVGCSTTNKRFVCWGYQGGVLQACIQPRSIRCCTDWKTWKMSVRRLPKESW